MADCNHDCEHCNEKEGCGDRQGKESFRQPCHPQNHIKKVIGVVSGKGGVGKSLVTSVLAVRMRRAGRKVSILDADITGPSIPRTFRLKGRCRTRRIPSYGAGPSSPVPCSSSGPTSSTATWTICSSICLPERATCP